MKTIIFFKSMFSFKSIRSLVLKLLCSTPLYLLLKTLGRLAYSLIFRKRKVASYSTDVREYFKREKAQLFFLDQYPYSIINWWSWCRFVELSVIFYVSRSIFFIEIFTSHWIALLIFHSETCWDIKVKCDERSKLPWLYLSKNTLSLLTPGSDSMNFFH